MLAFLPLSSSSFLPFYKSWCRDAFKRCCLLGVVHRRLDFCTEEVTTPFLIFSLSANVHLSKRPSLAWYDFTLLKVNKRGVVLFDIKKEKEKKKNTTKKPSPIYSRTSNRTCKRAIWCLQSQSESYRINVFVKPATEIQKYSFQRVLTFFSPPSLYFVYKIFKSIWV